MGAAAKVRAGQGGRWCRLKACGDGKSRLHTRARVCRSLCSFQAPGRVLGSRVQEPRNPFSAAPQYPQRCLCHTWLPPGPQRARSGPGMPRVLNTGSQHRSGTAAPIGVSPKALLWIFSSRTERMKLPRRFQRSAAAGDARVPLPVPAQGRAGPGQSLIPGAALSQRGLPGSVPLLPGSPGSWRWSCIPKMGGGSLRALPGPSRPCSHRGEGVAPLPLRQHWGHHWGHHWGATR